MDMENEDLNRTIYPPRTADATLIWFIEAVKKLAFEMPPENNYTSRFVMLCILAANEVQDRAAAKHNAERAQRALFEETAVIQAEYDGAVDRAEGHS